MIQEKIDHIGDTNKMVTAVDTIIKYCEEKLHTSVNSHGGAYTSIINFCKQQAKEMEKEQMGYTKEDVLMAGFIGEINHFDTKHIVSLLDEAKQYNETHGDK